MNKLKMQTANKADENFKKLAEMFPNAVTETIDENGEVVRAIDKDVLMQEINTRVVEGKEERYQFTWPDKKKSVLLANAPINKTLRPFREESVDFDNTENLYIQGDNLEVLKLLQETYLGKIKMIYIDPPYNTGNDFVYEDDFAQSTGEYLANSGQFDEDGNRLVKNLDSNGRFHTDWLNMIYPRLKLAKDLLSEDGAIFISLDDNEIDNLRKVCDEIFGQSNFVANLKVLSNPRGRQSSLHFATAGEYVLVYAKCFSGLEIIGDVPSDEQIATYNKQDEVGRFRDIGLRKRGSDSKREDSPTLFFPIYYCPQTEDISLENKKGYIEIIPKLEDGSDGRWRWSPPKIKKDKHLLYCRTVNRNGEQVYDVFQKDYFSDKNRVKHKNFWIEKEINYDRSSEEIREIFTDKLFDFAKPLYLIRKLINTLVSPNEDAIILDFFSGSSTTAHAVMQLNAEDGGNRKFIMVQLPEEIVGDTNKKYKTICEIGKERIRRAGKKIKEERNITIDIDKNKLMQRTLLDDGTFDDKYDYKITTPNDEYIDNLDTGFRVLKCDSSNMKDVYYSPNDYDFNTIDDYVSNIKEDRTPEDLLFQVMLDLGVLLSSKIEESTIDGKKVFNVADNFLIACFDNDVTEATITEIAMKKPYYFVMRDSSMANDSVATNFDQIFATYSPDTVRKVL